jgi:hypothetical protein
MLLETKEIFVLDKEIFFLFFLLLLLLVVVLVLAKEIYVLSIVLEGQEKSKETYYKGTNEI